MPIVGYLILLALIYSPVYAEEKVRWINPDLSTYTDLPIEVHAGVQIDQITTVNQREENFGVVGNIKLEWQDPNLSFVPVPGTLPIRRYETSTFSQMANEENIFFPSFSIYNQQGRKFSEESGVVVDPDGKAVYVERFTAILQAPDFDFTGYPFDTQRFFIAIETQWPVSVMSFVPNHEFSRLGDQLGEEEWVFDGGTVEVTSQVNLFDSSASRIIFSFNAHRHVWFYILRIIIPLLIIVVVSWATFFLRDFSKRVDISSGNLLVFVAFNFTISNDLPRLGYLTFMDTVMAAAFIITGLTVVWNVFLRRLELVGKEHSARVVDSYTLWIYPGAFIAVILFSWDHFFRHWSLTEIFVRF